MRAARGDAGLEDTVDVGVMAVDGVAKAGPQQPRRGSNGHTREWANPRS